MELQRRSVHFRIVLYFGILSLGSILAFLFLSGSDLAILGSYALLGAIVGAIIFELSTGYANGYSGSRQSWSPRYAKLFVCLIALGIVVTALTARRDLMLLVIYPIASLVLVLQLRKTTSPQIILPQIIFLFLLSPLSHILVGGFYFGEGDLLFHVPRVESVIQTGNINKELDLYQHFPILFTGTSLTSIVTDIQAKTVVGVFGAAAYSIGVLGLFIWVRRLTDNSTFALSTAIGFIALEQTHHFAAYFFPEAFAFILTIFVLFLLREPHTKEVYQRIGLWGIIGGALIFTHHLTIFIFAFVVAMLVVLDKAINDSSIRNQIINRRMAFIFFLTAIVQWAFNGIWFLPTLFEYISQFTVNQLGGGGSSSSGPIVFGTLPAQSEIVSTVVYPPFLYSLLLAAFATFAVGWVYTTDIELNTAKVVFVAGILSSLLIFETPLPMISPNRIRLPWIPLFAVVIGMGILGLIRVDSRRYSTRIVSVVMVTLLLTAAPLAASDVTLMGPRISQSSYSAGEYQQLAEASTFADTSSENLSALWLGRITAEYFGTSAVPVKQINQSSIRIQEGLFLYQNYWEDYFARANSKDGIIPIAFGEESLDQMQATQSVVYDTGSVKLIYASSNTTLIKNSKETTTGRE